MRLVITCLLLLLAYLTDAAVLSAKTTGETVIESTATRIAGNYYYFGDGNYGITTNGGGAYTIYADAGWYSNAVFQTGSGIATGTMLNFLQTPVATNMIVSGVPANTFGYVAIGFVFHDPTNHFWVAIGHDERDPNGNATLFYGSLFVCTSTDGINFAWLGEIIQPQTPFTTISPSQQEIGGGGNCFVNNWLYVFFTQSTSSRTIGVARCDFTTFMTQAEAGTLPVFNKFHGGAWTELGLGGLADPLTNGLTGGDAFIWWDVKYFPPAGQYVMVVDSSLSATFSNLRIIYSSDALTWTGDYPVWSSKTVIYPTLFCPDAAPGCLGMTNFIFGTQTSTPGADIWSTMTTTRWTLHLDNPTTVTAGTVNAGTLNHVN